MMKGMRRRRTAPTTMNRIATARAKGVRPGNKARDRSKKIRPGGVGRVRPMIVGKLVIINPENGRQRTGSVFSPVQAKLPNQAIRENRRGPTMLQGRK